MTRLKKFQEPMFGPLVPFLRKELMAAGYPPMTPLPYVLISFNSADGDRPQAALQWRSLDASIMAQVDRVLDLVYQKGEAHDEFYEQTKELIYATVVQNASTCGTLLAIMALKRSLTAAPYSVTPKIELLAGALRLALPPAVFNATSELIIAAIPLATACGLNALQLLAEGRLNRLLPGHEAMQRFAALTPNEQETARRWVISVLNWEPIYGDTTEPSNSSIPATSQS